MKKTLAISFALLLLSANHCPVEAATPSRDNSSEPLSFAALFRAGKPFIAARWIRHQVDNPIEYDKRIDPSSNPVSEFDLIGFDLQQLRIIRNGIYARHGYIFESENLASYFGNKSWYKPDPNFTENRLTEIEKTNVGTIKGIERIKERLLEEDRGDDDAYASYGYAATLNNRDFQFGKVANCDIASGIGETTYELVYKETGRVEKLHGRCVTENELYNGYEYQTLRARYLPRRQIVAIRRYDQFPLGDMGYSGYSEYNRAGKKILEIPEMRGLDLTREEDGYYVALQSMGDGGTIDTTLNIFDATGVALLRAGGFDQAVTEITPDGITERIFVIKGADTQLIVMAPTGRVVFSDKLHISDRISFSTAAALVNGNTLLVMDRSRSNEIIVHFGTELRLTLIDNRRNP